MKQFFVNKAIDYLYPSEELSAEILSEIKNGEYICELSRPRNLPFHKKFFALLNYSFRNWDIDEERKNFDFFREDLIIECGYYTEAYTITGEVKKKAKSISFANMDDIEFEELYSKAIDVILKYVLVNYKKDDLENVISNLIERIKLLIA